MKNIVYTILICLFGNFGFANKNKVQIHLKAKSMVGQVIQLYIFENYISRQTTLHEATVDSSGNAFFSFKLDRSREAYIILKKNVFLFLSPNDNFTINYEDKLNITFEGKGAPENAFSTECFQKFGNKSVLDEYFNKDKFDPEGYKQKLLDEWSRKKIFKEKYLLEHQCTNAFQYFASGWVDYSAMFNLMEVEPFLKKYFNHKNYLLDDSYFDFIKPHFFENDSVLKYSQKYLSTLSLYVKILKGIPDTLFEKGITPSYRKQVTHLKGNTLEQSLGKHLFNLIIDGYDYKSDYLHFKSLFPQSPIIDILESTIKANNINVFDDKSLNAVMHTTDNKEIIFKNFLKKNKGKVIYLDFWATSCAPCVKEFPYSDSLQEKLSDQKVAFAYLSLDDNKTTWNLFLNRKKVNLQQHFLLNKSFGSELCRYFKIQSIPRYMLIDKKGVLVENNTTRPSDISTFEKIKKLL
ncbi:MAG: TlpA family protein disulfide reductase [Pseudarcicella sp.]|nr:TlpA family protein disulfide reductase [Pseudarcicella sp.]